MFHHDALPFVLLCCLAACAAMAVGYVIEWVFGDEDDTRRGPRP